LNELTYHKQTALRVNTYAVGTSAIDELAEVVSSLLGITFVSLFFTDRGKYQLAGEHGAILNGDISAEFWLQEFLDFLATAHKDANPIFVDCLSLPLELRSFLNTRIQSIGLIRFSEYTDISGCILLGSERVGDAAFLKDFERQLTLGGNLGKLLSRMNHLQDFQNHFNQMQTLSRLEIAVNSSTDLETSLDLLLNQGKMIFDYDTALLSIFNSTTLHLEYSMGNGLLDGNDQAHTVRIGDYLVGRAALERRLMGGKLEQIADVPPFLHELIQEEQYRFHFAVPVEAKGALKGVLELYFHEVDERIEHWRMLMDVFVSKIGSVIYDAEVMHLNQRLSIELENAYDTMCMAWVQEIETFLGESIGHTRRLAELAVQIGRKFGLSREDLTNTFRGALLHDIGMLRIPARFVQTDETINEQTRRLIQMHPLYAHDQIGKIDRLKPALDIPLYHHERWDGSGYPFHFKAEQIPLPARIFAVIDVWDAMSSQRTYRKPLHVETIHSYLRQSAGILFDPNVVDQFLKIV